MRIYSLVPGSQECGKTYMYTKSRISCKVTMSTGEKAGLLTLLQSQRLSHHCTKPKYRLKWLQQKGAVLVVVWSFLVNSVWHFLALGLSTSTVYSANRSQLQPTGIILIGSSLLYPIGGWLADSFLGRHKTIRYSTWIMWLAIITITVYQVLIEASVIKVSSDVNTGIFALLYVFLCIGLGGFQANIIQLGIDQLTEASSTEITSFITVYVLTLFTSGVAFQFINICNPALATKGYSLFIMLYVAVCVTLAVCLDFIFESYLVKECVPVTTNSVTLIARVVKFVFVNRHRDTGETGNVHKLDIAKHSLGGPFEDEHVEYVKTFFRMLVVITIGTVVGSQIIVFAYAQAELQLRFRDWSASSCFVQISIGYSDYVFGTIAVLAYEIVIYPLCNKCMPNISTTGIGLISVFLSLLRVLAFLALEVGAFLNAQPIANHNATDIVGVKSCLYSGSSEIQFSSLWVLILGLTEGLYALLLILSGYKFMWAQAPSSMKGLVIGMMYACLGLNAMLQSAISAPFLFNRHIPWEKATLTCGIWYYMMQAVVGLAILMVFVLLVKQYKQSQRSEVRLRSVSNVSPLNAECSDDGWYS